MLKTNVKVVEKGRDKWNRILAQMSANYDIYVGLPNTGQRYPYRSYEYGPQRQKGSKKQSSRVKTRVSENSAEFPLVAFVGFIQEFGSSDGKIPERSFLRKTIVENTKKYIALNVRLVNRVFNGEFALKPGLQQIGIEAENDVKKAIKDFTDPPNAESTIRAKGTNAPLKYKGVLQQSIRSFVKKR